MSALPWRCIYFDKPPFNKLMLLLSFKSYSMVSIIEIFFFPVSTRFMITVAVDAFVRHQLLKE